jgi:hypothetical protein
MNDKKQLINETGRGGFSLPFKGLEVTNTQGIYKILGK